MARAVECHYCDGVGKDEITGQNCGYCLGSGFVAEEPDPNYEYDHDSIREDLERHPKLSPILDINCDGSITAIGWVSPIREWPQEQHDSMTCKYPNCGECASESKSEGI